MGYEVHQGHPDTQETARLIRRWRWRRALWIVLGIFVVLVVVSATSTVVRDTLQKPLVRNDALRKSDVIIVLGSGTQKTPGDHLPAQAKQRVQEGLDLRTAGWSSNIILSGGMDRSTGLVESMEMLTFAWEHNNSIDRVFPEVYSKDTYENAKFSLEMMRAHGWKTAIVVTSPYHTWRACKVFRDQGADIRCVEAPYWLWPAPNWIDHLKDTKSVVREYGAIVYNWLRGQL